MISTGFGSLSGSIADNYNIQNFFDAFGKLRMGIRRYVQQVLVFKLTVCVCLCVFMVCNFKSLTSGQTSGNIEWNWIQEGR
jgi:hypothetical protein